MKTKHYLLKTTLILALIFLFGKTYSQNYEISFAGTGESTTVDSVYVENLTQGTNTFLVGTDILHLVETVGITEIKNNADNTLRIYPNPMHGHCNIEFSTTASSNITFELFDITGRKVYYKHELLSKGYHTYQISGLRGGIFTLKIELENNVYTSKIISTNETQGLIELTLMGTSLYNEEGNVLKSEKSLIQMQYNTGDLLKFIGKSDNERTIFMLTPEQSQAVTFIFASCTDYDDNDYAIVAIETGTKTTQIWMAENLASTSYPDGTSIPNVTDNTAWGDLADNGTDDAYCYYNNNASGEANIYGALYTWAAAMGDNAVSSSSNPSGVQGVCPNGWHLPSDAEWTELTEFLGGEYVAGGKMKESGTTHWSSSYTGAADNSSGFTGLPGGRRYASGGSATSLGVLGCFWSATEYNSTIAWYRKLNYDYDGVYRDYFSNSYGFSVRCVKDQRTIVSIDYFYTERQPKCDYLLIVFF